MFLHDNGGKNVPAIALQRLQQPFEADAGERSFDFLWSYLPLWENLSGDLRWPLIIMNMVDSPLPMAWKWTTVNSHCAAVTDFIPHYRCLACNKTPPIHPAWAVLGLSHSIHYAYTAN